MLGLTVAEAAQAIGARASGATERPLRAVTCDSRAVRPGDLFVALSGARADGHTFLAEVAARGAAAALIAPGRAEVPPGLAAIEAPDPLLALGDLACVHLTRLHPRIYGVTGTVGKTTAKDFLGQLLGGAARGVHVAPASYNSEIGLPLSVLGAPLGTRTLVLEYGVNAPGEMSRLLTIAPPHEAWITAVTPVHLEGMGSLETIAREKSLLAAAAPAGGRAWLPTALAERLAAHAARWVAPIEVLPGLAEVGLRVLQRQPGAWRLAHPQWGELMLPLVAEHEVELALAAARIAAAQGATAEELRARLAALTRPHGRLEVHRRGACTILDDAYNASPASVAAALATLAEWPDAGRRIAVLGTMNELGAAAEELHRATGRAAAAQGLDRIVAVGRGGAWIAEAAAAAGAVAAAFATAEAAGAVLAADLREGDVILLKASRAERLDRLLEPLAAAAARGRCDAVGAAGGE